MVIEWRRVNQASRFMLYPVSTRHSTCCVCAGDGEVCVDRQVVIWYLTSHMSCPYLGDGGGLAQDLL